MTSPEAALRLARLAQRVEQERVAAKPVVARLKASIRTDELWDRQVPERWCTVGVVQELSAAAGDTLAVDPVTAEALARYALVVVHSIAVAEYPRTLLQSVEAEAWKELASAHRLQSKYDAALRALDAADRCVSDAPALGYDRAVLQFARSLVLNDQHQFAGANALLREAREVFASYKDRRRAGQCLLLEGMIEQRQGHFIKASIAYQDAIVLLRETHDIESLASAYSNLAQTHLELGELDAAVSALHDAYVIFKDLGLLTEVARVRHVLGRVSLRSEKYHVARDVFAEVRLVYLGLHMPEEAGIAGLDLAETWLALGDRDRARRLVEEVVREFSDANLGERMLAAFTYLRDVIQTPGARAAVQHVRRYVDELHQNPLQLFVPLPEHRER